MWNENKSLALSRACVWLFAGIGTAITLASPWLLPIYLAYRADALSEKGVYLQITIFCVAAVALAALYLLNRLLANIAKQRVFVEDNIAVLRKLSWCCLLVGAICLASALYYLIFIVLAVAAAFIALIMRVVKNVFAKAVELKSENDLTI